MTKDTNSSNGDKDSNDQVVVPPPKKGGGNNKALKVIIIVIAVVVVLGIIAFASVAWFFKSTIDKATDTVNISQTDNGKSYKVGKGDSSFSVDSNDKSLPEDFPSTVLMIEPHKITSSSGMKIGDSRTWVATTEVNDSAYDSYKKLKSMYGDSGKWDNITESQHDDVYNAQYKNKSNENLSVGLTVKQSSKNDKTEVTYRVTELKK